MSSVERYSKSEISALCIPAEEELMNLLKYANLKKIKDFLMKNPFIFLHYPTKDLKTPLTAAVDRQDLQILTLLLEKIPTNLDDTTTQPCGRTILMYASYNSQNSEVLQVFLKKGADARKTDIKGWTCLQYAVVGNRLQNIQFLLDYGLSIDTQDAEGRTALMISVYLSHLDIFLFLLDRNASVDIRDKAGFTALQLAVLWRKRDPAIALIERGGDVNQITPVSRISVSELIEMTMPNLILNSQKRRKP